MLKETAPTVSIVCNTSKIQVALFRWVVKEGQAHRLRGQPAFWALGKSGGLTPPQSTQGSFKTNGRCACPKSSQGRGLFPHSLGSSGLLHHALVPLNAEEARGELLPSLEATFNGDDPLMGLDI